MELTLKYQNLKLQFWFQIDNVVRQHHKIQNPDKNIIFKRVLKGVEKMIQTSVF